MALHLDPIVTQALFLLLIAVVADTGVGILRSLVKGTFHLALVGNFLQTAVLPYIGSALVVALLTLGWPGGAAYAAGLIYGGCVALVGQIASKLGINLGFIKLPPSLSTGAIGTALTAAVEAVIKQPPSAPQG